MPERVDVAVVGLGPAGRALTHRLLAAGARVLAVDPHPDRRWHCTYGGWTHQLPGWVPASTFGASSGDTDLLARGRHRLAGTYVVLDNDELQRRLTVDGAQLRREWLRDEQLPGLAPVVVDCRGNLRAGREDGMPVQAAHGLLLPRRAGERLLAGAQAVLMDWRPADGSPTWGGRRASFCYVVPLPDGRVLAEETCLAGAPPLGGVELASRLVQRLRRAGVDPDDWRGAEAERVFIPMLPPASSPVPNRFGAAGDQLNPMSGYSVFRSLAAADSAAQELLTTGRLAPRGTSWRRRAQDALLQLDGDATLELFDAFGRLTPADQRTVLDPHAGAAELLPALARQWRLMPPHGRRRLVAASIAGALP